MNYAIKEPTPSSLLEPGIRHDLRNLLACLGLDVEHLSRHSATHLCDCHCCKTCRSASARAMKGVQRIEALLLNAQSPAFATTGLSAPPADRTREPPIPIREILTEVVETLEPAIPRGMRITLNVAPDISVRASPVDVFRILLNLLRNAVDVAIQSGKQFDVRITGGTMGGRTSVMISDSGPGLPAAVRHGFDLPVRAPQNRPGRGQGLLIARHLAQINGGAVRIAATGAVGTIFEIVLPDGSVASTALFGADKG